MPNTTVKPHFVICSRNISEGAFGSEPGTTTFLLVPDGTDPTPGHSIGKSEFLDKVMRKQADGTFATKDILVFIHGYNNPLEIVRARYELLRRDLEKLGYQGAVISFAWPSANQALNYLEDRSDARRTALQLVDDCIILFAELQKRGCTVNLHLLAHSTGAFVIREAFDDADDRGRVAMTNWSVSQVAFIGADVSSKSMSLNDSKTSSLYRHCVRLTNYSNRYDSVLKLSNVKRVGVAPRVGRAGLPDDHPPKAVNVDCSAYYDTHIKSQPESNFIGSQCHSWHIGDPVFMHDLLDTIGGDLDRHVITTRNIGEFGLSLRKP